MESRRILDKTVDLFFVEIKNKVFLSKTLQYLEEGRVHRGKVSLLLPSALSLIEIVQMLKCCSGIFLIIPRAAMPLFWEEGRVCRDKANGCCRAQHKLLI